MVWFGLVRFLLCCVLWKSTVQGFFGVAWPPWRGDRDDARPEMSPTRTHAIKVGVKLSARRRCKNQRVRAESSENWRGRSTSHDNLTIVLWSSVRLASWLMVNWPLVQSSHAVYLYILRQWTTTTIAMTTSASLSSPVLRLFSAPTTGQPTITVL